MQRHSNLVLAVVILINPTFLYSARATATQREDALISFARQRQKILSEINNNPQDVWTTLIWEIVRPMGDDPRVLDLCDRLISKTTNPMTAWAALDAVHGIMFFYSKKIKISSQTSKILLILDKGLNYQDMRVKLAALRCLQDFGPEKHSKLTSAYIKIFRDTPVVQVDYETSLEMLRLVYPLVKDAKSNAIYRQVIKSAAEKYNLMSILGSHVDDPALAGSSKDKNKTFKIWQVIMLSK